MGVIEIFGGVGKDFRVRRYAFLFIWKLQVKKCVPESSVYNYLYNIRSHFN